jgi:hypothetical protein
MRAMRALLIVLVACTSSGYLPRDRGRIATTVQNGALTYMREGRAYRHGLLGGGLVDVVQGNARAEAAAHTYHARQRNGFLVALLGIVAIGASTTLLEIDLNGPQTRNVTAAAVTALGGLALTLTGLSISASGERYRWDAINLFNDGVVDESPAVPPGAAPPSPTLRMR